MPLYHRLQTRDLSVGAAASLASIRRVFVTCAGTTGSNAANKKRGAFGSSARGERTSFAASVSFTLLMNSDWFCYGSFREKVFFGGHLLG